VTSIGPARRFVITHPLIATADGLLMMLLPEHVDGLALKRGPLVDHKEHGKVHQLPPVHITYLDSGNTSHTVTIDQVYEVPKKPKKNPERYATGLIAYQLLNQSPNQKYVPFMATKIPI
jgi:hypothetical protein